MPELAVQLAVEEEIGQARDDDFAAFFFNHADDVVVGDGVELDVDFPNQADTRLHGFAHIDMVEFVDEVADVFLERFEIGFLQLFGTFLLPFVEEGFRCALDLFIRPRAVEDLLQGVTVDHPHDQAMPEAEAGMETGLFVHALEVQR